MTSRDWSQQGPAHEPALNPGRCPEPDSCLAPALCPALLKALKFALHKCSEGYSKWQALRDSNPGLVLSKFGMHLPRNILHHICLGERQPCPMTGQTDHSQESVWKVQGVLAI